MFDARITPSINWPLIERAILSPRFSATERAMIDSIERSIERAAALLLLQREASKPLRTSVGVGSWNARNFEATVYVPPEWPVSPASNLCRAMVSVVDHTGGTGELAHFMALGLTTILDKTLLAQLYEPQAHWFLNPSADSG